MSLGHTVTTQVATGSNEYVESLLNAGWRWDTSSATAEFTRAMKVIQVARNIQLICGLEEL